MKNQNLNRTLFFVVATFIGGHSVVAVGKECDSELNANLREINTNVKANAEIVVGAFHSNFKEKEETTYTPMANFAAEIQTGESSSVFINGSMKYKVENESESAEEASEEGKKGAQAGDFRFGLRDAYFQKKNDGIDYKVGFMTYTIGEHLLLDDRGLGADVVIPAKSFTTRVFAAGILDPFSREKQTCISKGTFLPESEEEAEAETSHVKGKGRNFSITKHFAGLRIEVGGNQTHTSSAASSDADEFESTSVAETNKQASKAGLMYFVESRNDFSEFKHFPGAFGGANFGTIDFSAEGALQVTDTGSTFGYIGKAYRSFVLGNSHVAKLFLGYTAYNKVTGDEAFSPSYSNMFLADASQFLTKDNNILFAGAGYHPGEKIGFELQGYQKLSDRTGFEVDASTTYYYYKNSKLKVGANWIEAEGSTKNLYQLFAEVRHIF